VRNLAWSRDKVIAWLRRDVWRYITKASQTDEDALVFAAALLRMRPSEVRYLAQLQFILSDEVADLLGQMPFLIRRLRTTSTAETEVVAERIRGPIRWGETFAQRAATGVPHAFVTAPAKRAYDTPENEVLAFALHAISEFGRRTRWHTSTSPGPSQEVRRRVAEATRWRQARALIDVSPSSTPLTVSRVRAGRNRRRYQAALDVIELYQRFIARLDRNAIREAIEHRALLTSRDSVLLELHCAFDAIRVFQQEGWSAPRPGLLRPPLIYRGYRSNVRLDLYFQHAPDGLTTSSRYRDVQNAHLFSHRSGLIPDLVLKTCDGASTRWLMIEVKGGYKRGVADSARAATQDLLAYRRAFGSALQHQSGVYGLGYAWGAALMPSDDSEIMLCTPDSLPRALEMVLSQH
jgi:hypothetical protein